MATIKVYDSFEAARETWLAFEASNNVYAFQKFDWLERWYKYIGRTEGTELVLVAVWVDEQPLMLLPFGREQSGPFKLLRFLGGEVTDYFAPVLACDAQVLNGLDFPALWQEIKKALPSFDAARLIKIPEHIEGVANPFLQLPHIYYSESHAATLAPDWESYYNKQIKKKIRADSRRQRKRLAEIGEVKFVIAQDDQTYTDITKAMIEHKRRRYAETEVVDWFARDEYQGFYLDTQYARWSEGLIHVCAIYVGDEIVATHWGMALGKRFYFLMPTYAGGDWKRYSVGRVLLEELMQWCFDNHFEIFDFSLGGEQYKKEWCDKPMPLYEVLQAGSLFGQLYVRGQLLKKQILKNPWILEKAWKLRTVVHNIKQKKG